MQKDFLKDYSIFSKEFWENYYYYYGKITIFAIILLALVISGIAAFQREYRADAGLMIMGGKYTWSERVEAIADKMSGLINDINDDGHNKILINVVTLGTNQMSGDYAAGLQRADVSIATAQANLFILDEYLFNRYLDKGAYADISEYSGLENAAFVYHNEIPVGIEITNLPFVKAMDYLGGSKLYMVLRPPMENEKTNKEVQNFYIESKKIFEFIAKGGEF